MLASAVERLAEIADRLACPYCGAPGPTVTATGGGAGRGGTGDEGVVACRACGRTSAVSEGIWHAMGTRRPPRTPAQLANALSITALVYERLWRGRSLTLLSGRRFTVAEELAELEAAVTPGAGQVVVDVACSEGLYARRLAAAGATVLAVDHSLSFLRAAGSRAARAGTRLVLVQASAQQLPFGTGAVDAVAMGGSLNEIGDPDRAAAEMARVTRPGGRLFSMSLSAAASRRGRLVQALLRPSGIAFPSAVDTRSLFGRSGFDVVREDHDRVVLRLSGVRRPRSTVVQP